MIFGKVYWAQIMKDVSLRTLFGVNKEWTVIPKLRIGQISPIYGKIKLAAVHTQNEEGCAVEAEMPRVRSE